MKYLLIIFLCLNILGAYAQKRINNIDSIYYLVDTANTPLKDRMWDIGIESQYKYLTIKCPCLKFNIEPTFIYKLKDPGQKINDGYFSKLKIVSLAKLIELTKKTTDLTAQTLYIFYIIEKDANGGYIYHKTRLIQPRKKEVSIEYENIPSEANHKQ
ncbi:hypothetical protein LX99_03792 [Mucilaginibacter oryzae]|uniref:Uncharacterized protein n=1 Tax=Mucilaginibacter oryzae TaxID=468058 RepID=A0A316H2M3_9SPHI|nr:hypothetical protein [Mucilaginibacter oryzae]PWK75299.1 hypothetical protein LX99_03792 [Mucilaginibacter oryzae]